MGKEQAALHTVREAFEAAFLYGENQWVSDFAASVGRRGYRRADLVAFSDSISQTLDTACVVVEAITSPNGEESVQGRDTARTLMAPRLLMVSGEEFEAWAIGLTPEQDRRMHRDLLPKLEAYLLANRRSFRAPELLAEKRERRLVGRLAATSLSESIAESMGLDLVNRFERLASTPSTKSVALDHDRIIAALQLLVAQVIASAHHKQRIGGGHQLIKWAAQAYPGFFHDIAVSPDLMEDWFSQLDTDGGFRGLPRAAIDRLQDAVNKRLGLLPATPRQLAKDMLERLPLGDVVTPQFSVVDPECGAGSLLFAAYDQFEKLVDPSWAGPVRQFLASRIHADCLSGRDNEIVRLLLLLRSEAQPHELNHRAFRMYYEVPRERQRPTLILSDFSLLVPEIDALVETYVGRLLPGGLVGVVVPTWRLTEDSDDLPNKLLNELELLEMWETDTSGTVVLARKPLQVRGRAYPVPVLTHTNQSELAPVFQSSKRTRRYLLHHEDITATLAPAPVVAPAERLGDHAAIKKGLPFRHFPSRAANDWPEEARVVRCLTRPTDIGHYVVNLTHVLELPVRSLSAGARQLAQMKTKVLVRAQTGVNDRRVWAAVDYTGIVPSGNIFALIPYEDAPPAEVIAAVLNHEVAHAWVQHHAATSHISSDTLANLPWPALTEWEWNQIKNLVNQPPEQAGPNDLRVSQLISRAYGTPESAAKWVAELTAEEPPRAELWQILGHVIEVNPEERQLQVEISGWGAPFWMAIPDGMPGWVQRDDTLFYAYIPMALALAPDPEHVAESLSGYAALIATDLDEELDEANQEEPFHDQ